MSSCQGVAVKQTSMVNIQELDDDGLNTFLDEIINSKKGKERQLQLGIERAEYMAMEKAELQGLVGLIRKFDDAKEYIVYEDRRKRFRIVFQDHEPDELTGLLIGLTPNDAARAIQVFYAQGTTKECTPSEIYTALNLYLDNLPSIPLIGKALREDMPGTRRKARKESCRVCLKQSRLTLTPINRWLMIKF